MQPDKEKEMENLKQLLTASGEVIATLEEENNHLNAKSDFYEEVAEGLVIENETLLLKLQHIEEQKTQQNVVSPGKSVSFNLDPEQNFYEGDEAAAEMRRRRLTAREQTWPRHLPKFKQ